MPVSVVITAFDEQDNVVPLVAEVAAALGDDAEWEVIVVDDGSSDATAERLREAREHQPRLRVVRHRHNAGQSTALLSGVRSARYALVASLDGDGQNDPADLPRLIAAFRESENPNLIVMGERRERRDTWLRRFSSRVANGVRTALLNDDCHDTGCGLKVFGRETFLALPHFDHMHRFLPALYKRAGGTVRNVPVRHRPRRSGRSKYGVHNRLWVGLVDLAGVLWLARRPCRVEFDRPDN